MDASGLSSVSCKYYAFISYSHKDERWALWLQRKLERFKVPSYIRAHCATPPPRQLAPVFVDKMDMELGSLNVLLAKEPEASCYLIVICSPDSAQSPWIEREVAACIRFGSFAANHSLHRLRQPRRDCRHTAVFLPEPFVAWLRHPWRVADRKQTAKSSLFNLTAVASSASLPKTATRLSQNEQDNLV